MWLGLVAQFVVIWCVQLTGASDRCPLPEDIMPCRCRGRNDQTQIWCNHSDLDRVNGALENLMRLRSMPAIDELIVENNKMPTLPARAFGALRIGRLLLRNNGLESISRNAFAGLENSLEEIYIVEESLVDFPFDSIEQLRNLEAFTIEKSKIPLLPKFSGMNRLKHVRIDGSRISGLPVGAFAKMVSIKQIHIVNSNLVSLPDGIFGPLDTLQLANFSGNQISTVQRRSFARLPKLEVLSISKNRLQDAVTVGQACEELSSLKALDLSQNQFKVLPEGSFVHLRSLQTLNLARNKIQSVGQRSFTHLPALRKVDLSDNQLRNIPKLFFDTSPLLEEVCIRNNLLSHANEIGQLLSSLKSLRFLDLGANGITSLQSSTIADHSQLQKLDLSDNLISQIQKDSFRNVPSLVELSFRNNSLTGVPSNDRESWNLPSLTILDLSSNKIQNIGPPAFTSLTQLTRLDLSSNRIKSIGSLTFSGNLNLEELELVGNGLNSITFNSFSGLRKLRHLDLSRNHLDAIPSATFRELSNLERINLGHNRISDIPNDVFHGLKVLEELSLKSNLLGSIPPQFFNNLENLKELNLKQNAIAHLPPRIFFDLKNLRGLKLAGNQITTIDDTAFDNLQKLKGIDLSSNRITTLTSRSLKNLPNLEKFDARENRITTVENGTFENSAKLQMVDLAQNALERIPDFVKLPTLRVVDFSHNQILKLDSNILMRSKNLMELYLNDNKLTQLDTQVFQNLEVLTILDLDGNDLTEIRTGSFQNLPRLIYLRLSRNKIRVINNGAFKGLVGFDGLDLQENELESIGENAFEKTGTLKYLNLSHNNFDDMARMGLYPLQSLEVLDISFNRLRLFDDKALRHLQWLVELRVNDNGICFLPLGVFDGMSRLKMLVLKNNSIAHLYEPVFHKLRNNIAFLDFSGNPIVCDCELIWFRNLMTNQAIRELTDSSCETPEILKGQPIKSVRPGRMICSNSNSNHVRRDFKNEQTCPTMPVSKKKRRPISSEPIQKAVFADSSSSTSDVIDSSGDNDPKNQRRNKDEKFLASHDYVAGDSPTIYAGNIARPNLNQVSDTDRVPSGLSALSTLFGIPLPNLDLGLNLGISPSVSLTEKEAVQDKRQFSVGFKGQDPLPPSWIQRPAKVDQVHVPVTYEPPEYIPRRPVQPYIPLNPFANGESSAFLPSVLAPTNGHKNSSSKWSVTTPPKSTWYPSYPTVETGFIPIEPFFHANPAGTSVKNKTNPDAGRLNQSSRPTTPIYSTTHDLSTRSELSRATGTPPMLVTTPTPSDELETEDSAQTLEEADDDGESDTLSDFWGMFSSKNSTPVDFSAPIDTELNTESLSSTTSTTQTPSEVIDLITENHVTTSPPPHNNLDARKTSKGKSTIMKVKLEESHRSGSSTSNNGGGLYGNPSTNALVYTGTPRGNPPTNPLVPPVLIGQTDEPRDWYYKNYDIQQNPEEEIEKYLDRSRVNTVDDQLVDIGSTAPPIVVQLTLQFVLLFIFFNFIF